jgi:DNA modification methylase
MPATILVGDVRERLSELPEGSVQTVVTSPPYWGLRDYGTASWEGGDEGCDHKQATARRDGGRANTNGFNGSRSEDSDKGEMNYRSVCGKCGAHRVDAQLGLEETPEEYVEKMVEVFREVKRVLADDGTLWLNLGDSYYNNFGGGSATMTTGNAKAVMQRGRHSIPKHPVLKQKDLVGIPWKVALALQADGWYLRQDIIWAKPNPMPESVTDRCTKAHEYVFLLTKQPKYHFDNDAMKEPAKYAGDDRGSRTDSRRGTSMNAMSGKTGEFRNKRSVWSIVTKPFRGAHFAVMPEALVEPCVLAGSAKGDTVLDPFSGSGTVGVVALRHGRNYIGVELNPDYAELSRNRITGDQPLFNTVEVHDGATA